MLTGNSHNLFDKNVTIKTFNINLVVFDLAFIGRGARKQVNPWCRGAV